MEIEGVLKQQNAADFIGGYHGDEHYDNLIIYIDGQVINNADVFDTKYAKRVTIFVKSNVYFCDTETTAFIRYKQLDFYENKLIITNRWEYVGETSFIIQRFPVGMFSCNTSDIEGFVTNFTPYLVNSDNAPSNQIIDQVGFFGKGFSVYIKYLSEKNKQYYRGTVTYFASDNPPRVKAYLMDIYEYQSTRTIANGDVLTTQVEISNL